LLFDRLAAYVVLWSELLATDPEVRVRFPALPDLLRSSVILVALIKWCPSSTWRVINVGGYRISIHSPQVQLRSYLEETEVAPGLENREHSRRDPLCWPCDTLYPQKLALTSPTSVGRLVDTVRSRTQATEFVDEEGKSRIVAFTHQWRNVEVENAWSSIYMSSTRLHDVLLPKGACGGREPASLHVPWTELTSLCAWPIYRTPSFVSPL
jgi:hypothetical protein